MIAMALACDPAIVIGDEPTTALDVMVQAQILELLEALRRELGLSLILITHDLSVIAETCDRVMVMYAGRVAEEGPRPRVFRRRATRTPRSCSARSRTSTPIGGRWRSSPARRRICATRRRAAGSIRAARSRWTSAREVVPPEATSDGVRVACHLYPPGSDGPPVTTPPTGRDRAPTAAARCRAAPSGGRRGRRAGAAAE